MAVTPEHYGLVVQAMFVRIECGQHEFTHNGQQEGPTYCPRCGRRFRLSWSANLEPYDEPAEASETKGTPAG